MEGWRSSNCLLHVSTVLEHEPQAIQYQEFFFDLQFCLSLVLKYMLAFYLWVSTYFED